MGLGWGELCSIKAWSYGPDVVRVYMTDWPQSDNRGLTRGRPVARPLKSWIPDSGSYAMLKTALDNGYALYADNEMGADITHSNVPLVLHWERGEDTSLVDTWVIARLCAAYEDKYTDNDGGLDTDKLYGRYRENLVRAAGRVQELGLCNDWMLFGTITCAPENVQRNNIRDVYDKVVHGYYRNTKDVLKRACKKKGGDLADCFLRYLIVPELHKDGLNYHLHGLFDFGDSWLERFADYYDWPNKSMLPRYIQRKAQEPGVLYHDCELDRRIGYNIFELIRDKNKSVNYLTKYIRKGFAETALKMEKGKDMYWASQGLNGKTPIDLRTVDKSRWVEDYSWERDREKIIWYHVEKGEEL